MSDKEKKKFVQLFTQQGAQFQLVTAMSFAELDQELAEVNDGYYIDILGEDEQGERVTLKIVRTLVIGYMYGYVPPHKLVQPARPGLVQ